MKIAHLINVTEITEPKKSSYLHIAQPVTIKTMIAAQKKAAGVVDVELMALKHKSENIGMPSEFRWAVDLDRYAWEAIDALKALSFHRPLPLLKDILSRFYDASDADYFIFTNLDIGLMPNFYIRVKELIDQGFDAFYVNRRDLPKEYEGALLDENSTELAYALEGMRHPGLDCFVFKREIIPQLNVGDVFVGYPPIGQVLKTQIDLHARKITWIAAEKLTFHIGRDKKWDKGEDPYLKVNMEQAKGLYVDQFRSRRPKFYRRFVRKIKSKLGLIPK